MHVMRRGQVTIFIVIGLVLLIAASTLFYLKSDSVDFGREQVTPPGSEPVVEFIQQCAEQTLVDGAFLLGSSGGYIDLPDNIAFNPKRHIQWAGTFKTPYWYYGGRSDIPSLQEMTGQLESYVNENMLDCLDNFTAFSDRFDITHPDTLSSSITLTKKGLLLEINYPITLDNPNQGQVQHIDEFVVTVDVALREMYETAVAILSKEAEELFFEDFTLNLMALDEKNVPFTGVDFSCSRKVWNAFDVQNRVEDLLYYNVNRVVFASEDNNPFAENTYERYNFLFDVDVPSNILVNAQYYPDFNMDFKVSPSNGPIMRSSKGKGSSEFLRFLCIQSYHFTYDVEYPVLIALYDPDAFGGEGFLFQYAFPVTLIHNEGKKENVGTTSFSTPVYLDEACNQDGREVEFNVYDSALGSVGGLKDVNITYSCLDKYICELGATKATRGLYRLETQIPDFCDPGEIIASKDGYLENRFSLDAGIDRYSIALTPIKTLTYQVLKKRAGSLHLPAEELDSEEEVIIYLESKNQEDDYYFSDLYTGGIKNMTLIFDDRDYEVNLFLKRGDQSIGGYVSDSVSIGYEELDGNVVMTFYVEEYLPWPRNDKEESDMYLSIYTNENPVLDPTIEKWSGSLE